MKKGSGYSKSWMSGRLGSAKVIGLTWFGYFAAVAVIWLDEYLNLPAYLGARYSPPRPAEALLESLSIILMGLISSYILWRLTQRLRYLEGYLSICSYCKRVRQGENWVPLADYITRKSHVVFSHGLCPDCLKEHYGDSAA